MDCASIFNGWCRSDRRFREIAMPKRSDGQSAPVRLIVSRALVVDQPWVGLIADGAKVWEMRTRPTKVRGWIGLIEKGTGTIIGVAYLKIHCLPCSAASTNSTIEDIGSVLNPGTKATKASIFSLGSWPRHLGFRNPRPTNIPRGP